MIVIGITGGIGHGKSTLAEAFRQVEPRSVHFEGSALIAEVIDAWQAQTSELPDPHDLVAINKWVDLLPPIFEQILHEKIDGTKLQFSANNIAANPAHYEKLFAYLQMLTDNPSLLHDRITPTNKASYRPILQWLGGYVNFRGFAGLWFRELIRRAKIAEAQGSLLCTVGGVRFPGDAEVIYKHKGYILLIERPLADNQDKNDPTERDRNKIPVSATISNNGMLSELEAAAHRVYADIQRGNLRNHYAATDT